jgi:hypothetical protein
MARYVCHFLVSLAYNLWWRDNPAQADRLRQSLREIAPQPAAIDEPSEVELRARNIDLPPGAFLKVTYEIEAATREEAESTRRTIQSGIRRKNRPGWWFVLSLPIDPAEE